VQTVERYREGCGEQRAAPHRAVGRHALGVQHAGGAHVGAHKDLNFVWVVLKPYPRRLSSGWMEATARSGGHRPLAVLRVHRLKQSVERRLSVGQDPLRPRALEQCANAQ
jgi:hypothetical protein